MRNLTAIFTVIILGLPLFAAAKIQTDTSLNWSGYAAKSGNFTGISGTWIIPTVPGAKKFKTDAAWVGIGGVSTKDLIQAGTEAVTGVPGKTGYLAWYELLPDFSEPVPLAVQSGDSVSVEIVQTAGNAWKIHFQNNSSGQSYVKDVAYNSSHSSAEWIEEMPSNADNSLIPLDNFGVVRFQNCYAWRGRNKMSIKKTGASAINLAGTNGRILAVVSALSRVGTGFEVRRLR